jgi:hypothetical protein
MGHASFSTKRGYAFNVNAAPGFTEIHTLQMKIAGQIKAKNEAKNQVKVSIPVVEKVAVEGEK